MRREFLGSCAGLVLFALAAFILSLPPMAVTQAQAPQTPPPYKGIFEPVNYPEDLQFNDVYFVNVDVGYVGGQAGTVLKTTGGGANWAVQLGGDPASQEIEITNLRFVDETHGWATQRTSSHTNLLRTTDGETWEPVGTIEDNYNDYFFTTETEGVFAYDDKVYRTTDAGATWKPEYTCRVRAEVNGLTREMKCEVLRMHFPSPTVGFALAYTDGDLAAISKTEDGGGAWYLAAFMADESARGGGIFFTDENNGVLRTYSRKSWITSDSGQTWKAMIATGLGHDIRFADPEVGWSFADLCVGIGCQILENKLSYTTDGGRRWTSRSVTFPAAIAAFSLPRRDRGYVVGGHGMIFRYRVVPATESVAKSIPAPLMPLFDSPLDEQVEKLDEQIDALQEALAEPGGAAAEGELPAEVTEQLEAVEATLTAATTEAPQFVNKHKNLNLILIGLQMATELPAQLQGFRESFQALKQGKSLPAAATVVPDVRTKEQGLVQMVRGFFQKP